MKCSFFGTHLGIWRDAFGNRRLWWISCFEWGNCYQSANFLERSCHPSKSSCIRCKVINVCWIVISLIPYTGRICERKWIATSRLHIFLFGKCLKVGRIWLYTISGKLASWHFSYQSSQKLPKWNSLIGGNDGSENT